MARKRRGRPKGPARGDRVNFPHHNDRAMILPDESKRDPDAKPAKARQDIPAPWADRSVTFNRIPTRPAGAPLPPQPPKPQKFPCPNCGARVRKDRYGTLYGHLIPDTTTNCPTNHA